MNTLSLEEKTKVIAALVEGNSIRATVRMTGVAKGTVTRLLERVGNAGIAVRPWTIEDIASLDSSM